MFNLFVYEESYLPSVYFTNFSLTIYLIFCLLIPNPGGWYEVHIMGS